MKSFLLIAFILAVCSLSDATTYYFAMDVPSTLGGTDYVGNQVVESVSATYWLAATLASGLEISALAVQPGGAWLFSPESPITLGGTDYEPRDVVSYNGSTYSYFLHGSAIGIPSSAKIDALFLNASGQAILSFDVPVTLGSSDYTQSDLVLYNGSVFSMYWNAETAGVPSSSNVVGADIDAPGNLVLTFNVPTTLGSTDYLPGQLVRWVSGATFANYFVDASWPASSQLRDFAFLPPSGATPGGGVAGTQLTATKNGGDVDLTWGASCKASDSDYEVYEGTIGTWYSHTAKRCTTGGATSTTITPAAGLTYYLVVPRNALAEGSYGQNSSSVERPQGASTCIQQVIGTCP